MLIIEKKYFNSWLRSKTKVKQYYFDCWKKYSINFSEQHKKFYLGLHYNGVNNYVSVNGVEIHKFKAKNSEINSAMLCLGNDSKNSSADNLK